MVVVFFFFFDGGRGTGGHYEILLRRRKTKCGSENVQVLSFPSVLLYIYLFTLIFRLA